MVVQHADGTRIAKIPGKFGDRGVTVASPPGLAEVEYGPAYGDRQVKMREGSEIALRGANLTIVRKDGTRLEANLHEGIVKFCPESSNAGAGLTEIGGEKHSSLACDMCLENGEFNLTDAAGIEYGIVPGMCVAVQRPGMQPEMHNWMQVDTDIAEVCP
jgi:hypothetical protein